MPLWPVLRQTKFCFAFFLQTGCYYVTQAGLELTVQVFRLDSNSQLSVLPSCLTLPSTGLFEAHPEAGTVKIPCRELENVSASNCDITY